ncbi:MAG TPA: TonB-dependent receptor, partial [Ignavibacteria bacterium]|nr:TonB-dependent receptor [Ignavibacteria bacterium]
VSVQDPLAGTGFGLQLSAQALEEVEVITGGYNAEYGQATSGVVNVKTKDGAYNKFSLNLSYKRDNLGFNKDSRSSFNTDIFEANISGPEPLTKFLFKQLLGIKLPGEITF